MLDTELMSVVATLFEERSILSQTSISFWCKKSGRVPALAMVACRTRFCRTEDPCDLAHSLIMEISSLEALTTEGCDIDGISNRPSDLSGTGYHDPRLVE